MRPFTAWHSQIALGSGSLSSRGQNVKTSCLNPSKTQRHPKSKNTASTHWDSALLPCQVSPKKRKGSFAKKKKTIKQGSIAGAASHRYG